MVPTYQLWYSYARTVPVTQQIIAVLLSLLGTTVVSATVLYSFENDPSVNLEATDSQIQRGSFLQPFLKGLMVYKRVCQSTNSALKVLDIFLWLFGMGLLNWMNQMEVWANYSLILHCGCAFWSFLFGGVVLQIIAVMSYFCCCTEVPITKTGNMVMSFIFV